MIYAAIYTHKSSIDGSISIEENDLRVGSIVDGEVLMKDDFDKLWESINEIDTKYLKGEEWYWCVLERKWEDDGSGSYSQSWFELIETFFIGVEP